ncbi:ATP synthase F1 subunit epsilon [Candidatus Gracilibacteria bacterium]|nr:ATP synthase F1 subunit epsilon [Candidatus Gracilibacteria bacterium]
MKLILISIKNKILDIDNLKSATIPTKAGEITVLENHEPIISALKPGILKISYNNKEECFAVGGGVLEINGDKLTITADMVEPGDNLDIEEIKKKKFEAKKLMDSYRETNKQMDMDKYIELEFEFLKESAKEQLALKK